MEAKADLFQPDMEKSPSDLSHNTDFAQAEIHTTSAVFLEQAGTKRRIKSRHAQMIAIGSAIGTGFFLGTGQPLARGGPGFLLISYCLMAVLVYGVFTAMIELTSFLPISGASIAYYSGRYVSPSLGFALGWLYFYSFAIIVAYELISASILINYWPNDVPVAVWLTILLVSLWD
jgi:amino acid transporter